MSSFVDQSPFLRTWQSFTYSEDVPPFKKCLHFLTLRKPGRGAEVVKTCLILQACWQRHNLKTSQNRAIKQYSNSVCHASVNLFESAETNPYSQDTYINLLEPGFYIEILAHPVGKMRIIQDQNKVALWNKRHFEEKKTEIMEHV